MRVCPLPAALLTSALLFVSPLWAAEESAPQPTFVISAPAPLVSAGDSSTAPQTVAPSGTPVPAAASATPPAATTPAGPTAPPNAAAPTAQPMIQPPASATVPATPPAGETSPSSANATDAQPQPFELPQREEEIPHRFGLGLYRDVPVPDDMERVRVTVLQAARVWRLPFVSLAWYAPGKKPGQGVALSADTPDGVTVRIHQAGNDAEALDLEKRLAFPISPVEIAEIYLQNEVVADDDFKGRPVIFESEVADIARGAFGKPYVFFPAQPGGVTGLTCYFDAKDPALRKLRKGSKVTVRAEVKGFLMQDVILDKCVVVEIH